MLAAHDPFPMYDFPELTAAHERLRHALSTHARRAGLADDVELRQVCGYPLIRSLAAAYDVVGAPRYELPFCEGSTHRALIVVAASSNARTLADLRGSRFAVNEWDSNTGMNLPRRLIAPLARDGRFFRSVVTSGSHAASLDAVTRGEADAASIDAVTFGLLALHRAHAVAGVRILAATAPGPTPPFVVPRAAGPRARGALYDVLLAALADPETAGAREALHLSSIEPAIPATYESLRRFEEEASQLGYGTLA